MQQIKQIIAHEIGKITMFTLVLTLYLPYFLSCLLN